MALSHRPRLIKANLVAVLATLFSVPVPLLLPMLVDEVLLKQPGAVLPAIHRWFPEAWQSPVFYIGLMVVISLILRLSSLALNVWQARQFAIVAKDIVFRIRGDMLERLKRIAMAEYELLGSGCMASRYVTDLETLDRFIGASVSKLLIASLSLFGTALLLLWMHWQLALLILFFNPMVIYFTTRVGKKVKELKRRENSAFEVFQQALTETLDAIYQIRAANREQHYLQALWQHARSVRDHAVQYEWQSDAASRLSFLLFQFGVDVFRAAAMLTVVFSDLSVGYMFAIFGYLWFMMGPVQEILAMQYSYFAANAALTRINKVFQLREEPLYPHSKNPFAHQSTVAVTVSNVHFAYTPGQDVLRGVSLNIARGEKVALVGASGGGKSTLVQVLLGMYTPSRGTVQFDGVPVDEIGLDVVREHVATVLQHPALFNESVRANLSMGRTFSDQELWEALAIAQLKAVVESMPEGLETILGRQGVRLSGGQRQRLAIARMVLANPSVVILDEATSALDAETEFHVHEALQAFLDHRTTLIIAHRLSAVKQADRVFVFEDGIVSEEGHHDDLLAQKGLYWQLYGERQH
ncbi:MAG: ABC transporter ATP-binding protein [Hahellaceae bacterium]|nr:ABC transporter ATP-binding protein [Hahellaceae bacterium]MCP5169197.1 ABC transporter ATP-binding protein [Hahellaceae bacterium]